MPRLRKDPELVKLQKDPTMAKWLDETCGSEKTRSSYLISMKMYVECIGKNPKELITEARKESKKLYPSDWSVKVYLIKFKKCMKERGMRDISVKTRLNPIYSFYQHYDIIFQHDKIKGDINPTNDEYPDKEMIRIALKFASPLMKAIILVGASSGLSMIDIANLKIKDFKAGYDSETGLTMLKLVRIKTKFKFITFLTPEATNAVIDYMVYRQRKESESMDEDSKKQLAKQRINGINQHGLTGKTLMEVLPASSDFLFIKTAISDKYLIKPDEQLRQLKTDNIDYMYDQINIRSGLATPDGERNIFLSHQLRKFCDNQLIEANINPDFREFFLAHKPPGSQANYHKFAQKLDALKAEYIKAISFLTIAKELDVSESDEFKRIKAEHETLIIEAEKYRVERSEIKELKNEIIRMKQEKENEIQLRDTFFKLLNVYVGVAAPGNNWPELEKKHLERMSNDPEYSRKFNEYSLYNGYTKILNGTPSPSDSELRGYVEQKQASDKKFNRTLDALLDNI